MKLTYLVAYVSIFHVFMILTILMNVNSKPWDPVTAPKKAPLPAIMPTPTTVPRICGKSKVKKSRIISGTNTTLGEWPWQVSFYFGNDFLCGGILIDPLNVLTAAHCMYAVDVSYVTAVLGDYTVGLSNIDVSEQRFRIVKYVNHDAYDYPTYYTNDISIVHLEKPAMLNQFVQPVCLPEFKREPPVGKKCFITGWGNTILNGFKMSNVLQKTSLEILHWNLCNSKNHKIAPITSSMFCGANIKPSLTNHSACHGDSGGPLVCLDNDGSWEVQGIVSWGSAVCDTSDAYTVFAKVSKFVDWILHFKKKNIKKIIS